MNGFKLSRIVLISLFIFLCSSALSFGAVPQLVNYQGALTDASGTPVPDGQYSVVFNIYDVATGG
ncbi:MAG TPA: hypothetical protein VEF37_04245, partial [Thermodesulfovibrionales bacterium]|nr:hypothetical protein [Thermodesulfovibrionales bacterium]